MGGGGGCTKVISGPRPNDKLQTFLTGVDKKTTQPGSAWCGIYVHSFEFTTGDMFVNKVHMVHKY